MNVEILEKIGLTKGETKTYIFLLIRPQITVTEISKETKLNRSNLYNILESLEKKGLVNFTIINKTRYYSAKEPKKLKEIIDQKIEDFKEQKKEINKFSAEINKLFKKTDLSIDIEFYEGLDEIKQIFQKILKLKKGSTVYSIGYGGIFDQRMKYFFKKFKNERIKKEIIFKAIFKEPKIKKEIKHPLTEIKYMPLNSFGSMEIAFFKDTVILFTMTHNPKAIYIKNKDIYRGLVDYFNTLWNLYL